MQFDVTQEFPVGLDPLWAALGRADYVERKYLALGSTRIRIARFTADADSIEVELDRHATPGGEQLPAWARVLSGKAQALRHYSRWRRAARDQVDVEVDIRAPALFVDARGTGSVRELSPGCSRLTLHFDVTSRSPVFASKAARAFARQVQHALQADHAFTLEYLQSSAART